MSTAELVTTEETVELKPIDRFRADLEKHKGTILAAAPSHIEEKRFLELAARCCIANNDLLSCTPRSLFTAVAEAASLGLDLDGILGHAYLIPFKNHGVMEATLVPGYKGIKELAYRSERVAVFDWAVVRPGDDFEYRKGTEQFLNHTPSDDEPTDDWTHVWAMGTTVYGGKRFEVMSKKQVEAHRDKYSKGWKRTGSAWLTSPGTMALKTVALKAMKLLPLSPDAQRLVERASLSESLNSFTEGELPDGAVTPAEDLDELADELESKSGGVAGGPIGNAEADAIRQKEFAEAKQ